MLRHVIAAAGLIGTSTIVLVFAAPTASAGCAADPVTGEVICDVGDRGEDNTGDETGDDTGGGSSSCTHKGHPTPCQMQGGGSWNGECYVTPTQVEVQPRPPAGQTAKDGAWYYCIYPSGGGTYSGTTWVENGVALIDPVILARRAIASMDLDPIAIGIVPESGPNRVGLVGLPVWMWVANLSGDTFGPITASARQGPVSVSATANVSGIAWDMGDGTKVNCTGPGTPYADHYGKQESPTCGHRYAMMSTDQPDGAYQVTATSHWVVEWSGAGQSGIIELDLTTNPLPIRVGEAQVLTQ